MDSVPAKKKKRSKAKERPVVSDDNVPLEIRTQLQFDKDSGEFSANSAPQAEASNVNVKIESLSQASYTSSSKSGFRRQNKTIDGLIGQANVAYAKKKIDEALQFLREAIRQDPRHPEPYNQLANIYTDQKEEGRSFEYRLLSAHLDNKTSAEDWAEIGEAAVNLERIEEATACYANAVRCEPTSWVFYEKRIELLEALGSIRFAMNVRLQAAKSISCSDSGVDFDWLQDLIKAAAAYFIDNNDEDKAMETLKVFLLRCHEFNRTAEVQHLALLAMQLSRERYDEVVKTVLALCPSIKGVTTDGNLAMEITVNSMGYDFKPFLPESLDHFEIEDAVNTLILGRLVIGLLRLGRLKPIDSIVDVLLKRVIYDKDEEEVFLEIGRTYHKMEFFNYGLVYMEKLLATDAFARNPEASYLCALFEEARNNNNIARVLYETTLEIQPNFVNARINLSRILQRMGEADAALQVLMECDLDLCDHLPDERLLVRQADVLMEQKRLDQYIRCVRMILIPYFYAIYKFEDYAKRNRSRSTQCKVLYHTMLEQLRDTAIEKQIKRQGPIAFAENRTLDLNAENLSAYCMKLIEMFLDRKQYKDMLNIVCLASLEPKIANTGSLTFFNMTLFAGVKADNYLLAFEYLRYLHTSFASKTAEMEADVVEAFTERLYNAMNYVFCRNQNVIYHRFIMRAETKNPSVKQLQAISGNNSLVTGSYRHALNEYLQVWDSNRDDPLSALLIALTFSHIACKKDITSRHLLAMRGLAFMQIYRDLRDLPHETFYNMGRLLHQLSMFSPAAHFYKRVLNETQPPVIAKLDENTNEVVVQQSSHYDLRRCAAHNLALIYESSGNRALARAILEKHCKV